MGGRCFAPRAGGVHCLGSSGLPSFTVAVLSCFAYPSKSRVYGRTKEATVSIPAQMRFGFWWGKYKHTRKVSKWSHPVALKHPCGLLWVHAGSPTLGRHPWSPSVHPFPLNLLFLIMTKVILIKLKGVHCTLLTKAFQHLPTFPC